MKTKQLTFAFLFIWNMIIAADGYKDYIAKGDSLYKLFKFEAALTQYKKAYEINQNL